MKPKDYIFIILVVFCINAIFYQIQKTESYSDMEFIEESRRRFRNIREYSEDYNCVNYTEDFVRTMQEFGFEFEQLTLRNKTHAHRISCIPYDPQKGVYKNENYNKTILR